MNPIQRTRETYLNSHEESFQLKQKQVLYQSINDIAMSPKFTDDCLELILGTGENLKKFDEKPVFENLPKAAKQVVLDSMKFQTSLKGYQHLEGLSLYYSNVGDIDLSECNLRNCTLIGLFSSNMSRACLDGANLANFSMIGNARLDEASLIGTDFGRHVSLLTHRLHSCDLTKIVIDFSRVDSSQRIADHHLNHIHNENSVLLQLKNWPDSSPSSSASRAFLMHKLAEGLNRERFSGSYSALTDLPMTVAMADVVFRDSKFAIDSHPEMQRLRMRVASTLLSDHDPWSTKVFATDSKLDSKKVISTCMQSAIDIFAAISPDPELVGAVSMDSLRIQSQNSEPRKLAAGMSDASINLLLDAGLRHQAVNADHHGRGVDALQLLFEKLRESQWSRLPTELVNLLNSQGIDTKTPDIFIEQSDSRTRCLAFDDFYMKSLNNIMADKFAEPGFDWKNMYLFEKKFPGPWEGPSPVGQSSASQDPVLTDLLSFSLEICYVKQSAGLLKEKANQLFELASTSGASGKNDFSTLFTKLRRQASQTQPEERLKWLAVDKSNQLAEILGGCMQSKHSHSDNASPMSPGTMSLTQEHTRALDHALNDFCTADPQTRARWYFALGTTYTQLSSSTFMGTEEDSPLPVRTYAAALLSHARDLDPAVFRNQQGEDQFHTWHAQLCGEGQAFTCTAMLSYQLRAQCQEQPRDEAMKTAFATVYPTTWS